MGLTDLLTKLEAATVDATQKTQALASAQLDLKNAEDAQRRAVEYVETIKSNLRSGIDSVFGPDAINKILGAGDSRFRRSG